jgi:hypothetical protein
LDAIDTEIHDQLVALLQPQLPVQLVTMTAGWPIPDAIKNQRVAAQEQRIQTEKQKKLAEDSRLQAEQSRANADNAYRESMHLSPEQFIQLKQIEMQQEVCGRGGCTFIMSGGVAPVYNLGK